VWIANLRYRDSVEDKVHRVLAERLQAIHELFGQIPDTLKGVWVKEGCPQRQGRDRRTYRSNHRHPQPFRQKSTASGRCRLGEPAPLRTEPHQCGRL